MVKNEQDRIVRLRDAEIFRTMIDDRGYTVRTLSEEVQRDLRRRRQKTIGAKRSTIGNLHSGERDVVRAQVAVSIANVLKLKWSSLFSDEVCTVARETYTGSRTAA
ncbi:hypothetical protein [Nesterenkonia sp. K-15-9-6]|uniref:hypothetical protein n=1 Tax=Nesterenkonia sp. K-15-9-6 TaxID=3093918 RepID=UPI004044990E